MENKRNYGIDTLRIVSMHILHETEEMCYNHTICML